MSRLVLHSDHVKKNISVDEAFINMFKSNKKIKLGYIPSQSDDEDKTWFKKKCEWYSQFGITDILYFDIDKEYDAKKKKELLNCDAIFLSGGDTYYFLNSLKKRGFINVLQSYVKSGGVLIGLSAGAIMFSNTIDIVTLHDENTTDLKDFTALGLVDFDFFPHLNHNETYLNDIIEYSKVNNKTIYACNDGDGIIVNGDNIQFIGDVLKVKNGEVSMVK